MLQTFVLKCLVHLKHYFVLRSMYYILKPFKPLKKKQYWSPMPNFIELLKHKKIAKHNKIVHTRIKLSSKIPYHIYNLLISATQKIVKPVCLSSSIKLNPGQYPNQRMGLQLSCQTKNVLVTFRLYAVIDSFFYFERV